MRIYAIKDLNTDLFVTDRNLLAPLGALTRFFESRHNAERAMSDSYDIGFDTNPILDDLAWNLLENKYQMDRWHINVSHREYREAMESFDLRIVRINLSESKSNSQR